MIGDDLKFDIGWQLQYGPGKRHVYFCAFDPSGPCCPCNNRNVPDSECTCMEWGRKFKEEWKEQNNGRQLTAAD